MPGAHGIEIDELGYAVSAVAAWKKHGIYPPPPIGDANDPAVVAQVKALRARVARLTPEQQRDYYRDARAFMTGFLRGSARPASAEDL